MVSARNPPSILQLVRYEIQAPGLVRRRRPEPLFGVTNGLPPPLWPPLQGQSFFLVEPVDQVLAHLPSLTSEKNQDFPVPVTNPALRNLPNPGSQLRPRILVTPVAKSTTDNAQIPTGMPFAGPVLVLQIINQMPAPRRLHHFFHSIS